MDIFIDRAFYSYFRQYPIKLVDVGASSGFQDNWKGAEKFLQVIAFEPDEREFENLVKNSSSNIRYLNTVLQKERTTCDFYMTRKQQVSSLFPPNRTLLNKFPESERFDILETKMLESDSLDSQLEKEGIADIDFIKLDTQGSELFILQGATKTLRDVFGLEIEVEFSEIYENQPLFSDIDMYVRRIGFQLLDLKPYYWKRSIGKDYGKSKGQLVFADALYLKDVDIFLENLDRIQNGLLRKSKVLRAISICVLYGYYDYALELFESRKNEFNQKESRLFNIFLKKNISLSNRIPNFRGRDRIASILEALYRIFTKRHDWAESGKSLGNLE